MHCNGQLQSLWRYVCTYKCECKCGVSFSICVCVDSCSHAAAFQVSYEALTSCRWRSWHFARNVSCRIKRALQSPQSHFWWGQVGGLRSKNCVQDLPGSCVKLQNEKRKHKLINKDMISSLDIKNTTLISIPLTCRIWLQHREFRRYVLLLAQIFWFALALAYIEGFVESIWIQQSACTHLGNLGPWNWHYFVVGLC